MAIWAIGDYAQTSWSRGLGCYPVETKMAKYISGNDLLEGRPAFEKEKVHMPCMQGHGRTVGPAGQRP